MTPKQKYDERKKLRAERLLRQEQRSHDVNQNEKDMEVRMESLFASFEKIALVMELWADQQK